MDLKSLLQSLGIIAVIFTLVPFVAADYWWIRIFDYPHVQLTVFTLVTFLIYFFRFDIRSWRDYVFVGILAVCFVFQLLKIYPYTPFADVKAMENENVDPENSLSILAANVLQKNKHHQKLLDEILRTSPDLIILTETDEIWEKAISPALQNRYPYQVKEPLDNTYGILLYSSYPLIGAEVRYLVNDTIPSIHGIIKLPSGQKVQLHAIHPTPPMPQENPSSSDRDAEMMMVAKMARNSKLPVVVTGDFNDVAWSHTTSLFIKASELLDPRMGRGFFNTFNANSWLMRWPLDHLFISEEFRVVELERGEDIESDHFPLYSEISFEPEVAAEQEQKPPSPEVLKEANKQIKKVK
ncbi:MAG TPA: endonuclease/exonuclease/phosphatase family protein [Salinimicrobium sp.]|nr:endonuclease/exonuclease/phosphatase family protein [Salinimicrobium sp.]